MLSVSNRKGADELTRACTTSYTIPYTIDVAFYCDTGGTRTHDQLLRRQLLYPLSYGVGLLFRSDCRDEYDQGSRIHCDDPCECDVVDRFHSRVFIWFDNSITRSKFFGFFDLVMY